MHVSPCPVATLGDRNNERVLKWSYSNPGNHRGLFENLIILLFAIISIQYGHILDKSNFEHSISGV